MAVDLWFDYFSELSRYLAYLSDNESSASSETASEVLIRLDGYFNCSSKMIDTISNESLDDDEEGRGLKIELTEMLESLRTISSFWMDKEAGMHMDSIGNDGIVFQHHSGGRGRPRFIIPINTLRFLRELN